MPPPGRLIDPDLDGVLTKPVEENVPQVSASEVPNVDGSSSGNDGGELETLASDCDNHDYYYCHEGFHCNCANDGRQGYHARVHMTCYTGDDGNCHCTQENRYCPARECSCSSQECAGCCPSDCGW